MQCNMINTIRVRDDGKYRIERTSRRRGDPYSPPCVGRKNEGFAATLRVAVGWPSFGYWLTREQRRGRRQAFRER